MPSKDADLGLISVDNPIPAMLDEAADRHGVPRNLVHAVVQMESRYNPRAHSPVGAMGLMQLMPATARSLGVKDPWDPAQNIEGGVKYLAQLSKRYGGDPRFTMAAYNAGPGAVDKYGGVPPFRETRNYVATGMQKIGGASREAKPGKTAQGRAPADADADLGLVPVEQEAPAAQGGADLGMIPVEQTQSAPQAAPEIRAPLSEPPDPNAKPPESKPPEKTFEGFMGNVGQGVVNLLSPVLHPVQTVQGISELGQAMAEKSGFKPVMGQSHLKTLDSIADMYKQRYGSWQGFKDAWYQDPVGMASDLATVVSGAGLGAKAAQDFIKIAGLSEQAAAAANAAGKIGTVIKGGSVGAIKALPSVPGGMLEGAIYGGVFGPGGVASGAKLGGVRTVIQGAKEGAREALAARTARVAEALKAEEEARAAQRIVIGDRPPRPAPAPSEFTADWDAIRNPQGTSVPAAMPEAPAATVQDLSKPLTGKSPSKLNQTERATVEAVVERTQNPLPVESPELPEPPRTLTDIQADFKQHMSNLQDLSAQARIRSTPELQDAITREMDTVRGLWKETPSTGKPAAQPIAGGLQASESALESRLQGVEPLPRQAPMDWAGVSRGHKVDALFDFMTRNRIPAAMAEDNWETIAKYAGVKNPSQNTLGQLRQRLAAYEKTEGFTPPPAGATLESQLGQLTPGQPMPRVNWSKVARDQKVNALFDVATKNRIPLSMMEQFGEQQWKMLADYAGVDIPSETSIGQLKQRLADYEKARNIPVTKTTTPAEAQAAFKKAKRTRRRTPPER